MLCFARCLVLYLPTALGVALLAVSLSAESADAARRASSFAGPKSRYDGWVSIEPRRWPKDPKAENATSRRSSVPVESQPDPVEACVAELARNGIFARAGIVPAGPIGSDCGIDQPVNLMAVAGANGPIRITGEPLLACTTAKAFGGFVRDIVAPLAKGAEGAVLQSVSVGGGYECRPRNHVAGAKPSAHGRGLAIDVMSFALADNRQFSVKDNADREFIRSLRTAACGVFTTVLGPGSDAAHATHLHLDLERHGSSDRYRICE